MEWNLSALIRDESGATAVEYGIMVAAIAATIIAVVIAMGGNVNDTLFQKVLDNLRTIPGLGDGG